MWTEAGVDICNEVVDRAHITGPSYTDKNLNVECKSVIVCFTTFWHRAMVYRVKKKRKQGMVYRVKKKRKQGVRVKLDLTKSRYTLLIDAKKIVKQNPDIKFFYADINCWLKIKWVDESIDDKFFSSMDEL